MKRGKRADQKAKTRQAILDAAVALFSEKGYEQTSILDLAQRAGIGKSTVYTYFEAKEDIFLAFCDAEIEFSFNALREQVDQGAPVAEQLLKLFMLQFQFVTHNREFGRILVRETAFPKKISDKARETDQRYLDALDEILRRAQGRGEIHVAEDNFYLCVHFYMLYLGALSGFYTGYVTTLEEVEAGLEILLGQALRGIAK